MTDIIMKKDPRDGILVMILVLTVICGISGLGLASLKQVTALQIEEQVLTYVQGPAILQVLSGFENDPVKDRKTFTVPGSDEKITIFPAIVEGTLTSVAMETYGKGYGGDIGVMVGFSMQKPELTGIGITTMKETPGLGARIAEVSFTRQFVNHPFQVNLKAQGGDIDAISGATISSAGTVSAITRASAIFEALKPEFEKAWNVAPPSGS